ncbi:MAG: acyltransferase [Bacteroidota bacterium]
MSKQNNDLRFLDGLRGLAALYVMIGHTRLMLWEGFTTGYKLHPEQYSKLSTWLMYFLSLFKYGHEAVLLFFVLSGFVIHLKYARQIKREGIKAKFDTLSYYWRRLKRVYPPLILALGLTLFWDKLGLWLELPVYLANSPYPQVNHSAVFFHDWYAFIGNLLSVQIAVWNVPVWGTNGPLWSLALEVWFYVFYPLMFLAARRTAIGSFLLMITISYIARRTDMYLVQNYIPLVFFNRVLFPMLFWWFGVVVADIYTGRINLKMEWLSMLMPLAVLLTYLPTRFLYLDTPALHSAMFFAGMLATLLWIQKYITLDWLAKLKWLGDMSYSLYIHHMPLVVFMSGLLMARSGGLLPQSQWMIVFGACICLAYGYLTSLIAEKPFTRAKLKEKVQEPAQ